MTDIPENAADRPTQQAPVRVTSDGVNVRKIASRHRNDAVAVDLTILSNRDDRCVVRIEDTVPEAVRDEPLEFHPRYDPENWSDEGDSVVYEAPIGPGVVRRTVYGVMVGDPARLDLFWSPPDVAVSDYEPEPVGGAGAALDGTEGDDAFSFGHAGDSAADAGPAGDDTSTVDEPAGRSLADDRGDDRDVVQRLVSAVRRRDLTRAEQRALREAVGVEDVAEPGAGLTSLREEVEALRNEVAAADRQAADVDRIESRVATLSQELEERSAELSAAIASLEEAVEREARWRDQLRRSLRTDPDD